MTKLLSYIRGATFIIVLSLCFVTKLGKAQESAIVAGRVIAQTTKTPIAFADVWLKPGRLNTITNSAGEFEIRGVKSGNYELWVKSVGFESFSQKVEIIENLPFYFSIELKNDVRFIKFPNKCRIREAVRSYSSIDTLYPKRSEVSLLCASVAISIKQALFVRAFCNSPDIFLR
jgi:hypothetical protein